MIIFKPEPLWQYVLSHTSFLCLTCSAGLSSLSCFCSRQMFLWTAATITHNSLYSFMLLYIFGLLLKWEGNAARYFCHFGKLLLPHEQLQEDILLIGIPKVTFTGLLLQVYISMATLSAIQSARKILCSKLLFPNSADHMAP